MMKCDSVTYSLNIRPFSFPSIYCSPFAYPRAFFPCVTVYFPFSAYIVAITCRRKLLSLSGFSQYYSAVLLARIYLNIHLQLNKLAIFTFTCSRCCTPSCSNNCACLLSSNIRAGFHVIKEYLPNTSLFFRLHTPSEE